MSMTVLKTLPQSPWSVEPDFGFLAAAEQPAAQDSYTRVLGVIRSNPRPAGALFDIDNTLEIEGKGVLVGRNVGAMYAFFNSQVPIGLYSVRPMDGVKEFFGKHPSLSRLVARCKDEEPLLLGNEFFTGHMLSLCEGVRGVRAAQRTEESRVCPGSFLNLVDIYLGEGEGEKKMNAPKFAPYRQVVMVDDKDYGERHRAIFSFLLANGGTASKLFEAAFCSMRLFWCTGEPTPGAVFSYEELSAFDRMLEGASRLNDCE